MKVYNLTEKAFRMKASQYLREYLGYSGRILRNIEIYLDDKKIKTTTKLPKSGTLKIIEKEKGTNIAPIELKLNIIFEDEDLLIVNKPPFLLTHPTQKKVDITLANGIVYYYKNKYNKEFVPRFISRLDMNTSGIILVAKNAYTQSFMQSESANITKKYLTLAEGIADFNETVVEANIYKDGDNLERIINEKGQYAKTKFIVLEKYKHLDLSLIECELFTGRTHQIRVHLKYLGLPIIGDTLYNSDSVYNKIVNRQMLHSYYISFIHPSTKEKMEFKIPLYKDMKEILE